MTHPLHQAALEAARAAVRDAYDEHEPWGGDTLADEAIAAYLAAIEAERPSGWRPIATAPKDGTWILARFPSCGEHRYMVVQWHCLWDNWILPDLDRCVGMDGTSIKFSHWQPLPPPPKEGE